MITNKVNNELQEWRLILRLTFETAIGLIAFPIILGIIITTLAHVAGV